MLIFFKSNLGFFHWAFSGNYQVQQKEYFEARREREREIRLVKWKSEQRAQTNRATDICTVQCVFYALVVSKQARFLLDN